jgi:hypothetical protein
MITFNVDFSSQFWYAVSVLVGALIGWLFGRECFRLDECQCLLTAKVKNNPAYSTLHQEWICILCKKSYRAELQPPPTFSSHENSKTM